MVTVIVLIRHRHVGRTGRGDTGGVSGIGICICIRYVPVQGIDQCIACVACTTITITIRAFSEVYVKYSGICRGTVQGVPHGL